MAGIVTIRHSGRRIVDVTVHEEDGWEAEIEQNDDEVQVSFSRDGAVIEFQAQLRDGELGFETAEPSDVRDAEDDESGDGSSDRGRGRSQRGNDDGDDEPEESDSGDEPEDD